MAVIAWRRRPAPAALALALLNAALFAWSFPYALSWLAGDPAQQHFWLMVSYVGVVLCPPLTLFLVLAYLRRTSLLRRWMVAVLVAEPIVTLLIVATDSWHGWFLGDHEATTRIFSGGPWFWVNVVYGFGLIALAAVLLLGRLSDPRRVYRIQSAALLLAVLIPVFWTFLGVVGVNPVPDLDLTPVAFTISSLLFAFALFRLGLLKTVPIARDQLIESMAEGVAVVDAGGVLVDLNPAACALLGLSDHCVGKTADEVFAPWPDVVRAVHGEAESVALALAADAARHVEVLAADVCESAGGERVGTLVTLRDVTERVQTAEDLQLAHEATLRELRERLGVEEALRRRVAELHTLQRISALLAGRADLQVGLASARGLIAALFEASCADVVLLDGERPTASDNAPGELRAAVATTCREYSDGRAATDGHDGRRLVTPLVANGAVLGSLLLARREPAGPFTDDEQALARTTAGLLAAVIHSERLHEMETQQAAANERQRIARELHDAVTQSIYAANLVADGLPGVWERDPEEGRRDLEAIRRLIRSAFAELRILLYELRPETLASAPIHALLQRLGDALAGQGAMQIELSVVPDLDLPSPEVRTAFYRIAQEALNNVGKYAGAKLVNVVLRDEGEAVRLIVQDDGCGFDVANQPAGMGQIIMRERAAAIGAQLTVRSTPGEGTTIVLVWRWPQTSAAASVLAALDAQSR